MNKDIELENYCGSHTDCGNRCDDCIFDKEINQYKTYNDYFDDDYTEDFDDEEFDVW